MAVPLATRLTAVPKQINVLDGVMFTVGLGFVKMTRFAPDVQATELSPITEYNVGPEGKTVTVDTEGRAGVQV